MVSICVNKMYVCVSIDLQCFGIALVSPSLSQALFAICLPWVLPCTGPPSLSH